MAADANWTTICPHCGAASEDDAICRACGKLLDESQPIRPFSARRVIDKVVASWSSHPTHLSAGILFLLLKKSLKFVRLGACIRAISIIGISKLFFHDRTVHFFLWISITGPG